MPVPKKNTRKRTSKSEKAATTKRKTRGAAFRAMSKEDKGHVATNVSFGVPLGRAIDVVGSGKRATKGNPFAVRATSKAKGGNIQRKVTKPKKRK